MADFLYHEAKAGERWDMLSQKYYGNIKYLTQIQKANHDQYFLKGEATPTVFKGGEIIKIPFLEQEEIAELNLPPWKR